MSVATHEELSGPGPSSGAPPAWLWRCSVDQYHEMIQAGILDENDRVELLDGWLVRKMTENPAHASAAEGTYDSLVRVVTPATAPGLHGCRSRARAD